MTTIQETAAGVASQVGEGFASAGRGIQQTAQGFGDRVRAGAQGFGDRFRRGFQGVQQRFQGFGQRIRPSGGGPSMKTIVRAVGLLFTIALVVYIIIEWRKFTHSAIGKALAKILGDVGAALLWMANHPFLSIIGIILAVLLFPILTGFARGVFTKLKDGTEKLFEKQREGVDDESLKDPDKPADETELKAYEGATIDIVKEKVHKIVSDDPVLIPQEQQDEINARITDAKTTLYKEMKAEDPDIKDDTDAQDLMNEAGEKFGE